MIHLMTTRVENETDTVMLFKLTEPTDELEGEMGEFVPDRVVKLGLKGDVFNLLGYKYRGGALSAEGEHRFWYRSVERDRFQDGPLYYELVFGPDKRVKQVRSVTHNSGAVSGQPPVLFSDPLPLPLYSDPELEQIEREEHVEVTDGAP